jgi:hypothetical protein
MGTVEFLPLPTGPTSYLYQVLYQNLSGFAVSFLYGGLGRVPGFFNYTYETGLFTDQTDQNEKESIRFAIGRRAMIKVLPFLDPIMRMNSQSESLDGQSATISYNSREYLKSLKEEDKEFVYTMRKNYARNIGAVII